MTDFIDKNNITNMIKDLGGGCIGDYKLANFDYELIYTKGDNNPEKYIIKLDSQKYYVSVTTPDGETAIALYQQPTVNQIVRTLWDNRAANWKNDEELVELYNKYPYYFDVKREPRLTIFDWMDSAGVHKCSMASDFNNFNVSIEVIDPDGAVRVVEESDTNNLKPDEKYYFNGEKMFDRNVYILKMNKGIAVDHMKKILATYSYEVYMNSLIILPAYDANSGIEYNSDYLANMYNDWLK